MFHLPDLGIDTIYLRFSLFCNLGVIVCEEITCRKENNYVLRSSLCDCSCKKCTESGSIILTTKIYSLLPRAVRRGRNGRPAIRCTVVTGSLTLSQKCMEEQVTTPYQVISTCLVRLPVQRPSSYKEQKHRSAHFWQNISPSPNLRNC